MLSVVVLLVSILGHGLGVVTMFAKRLPVVMIPEQLLVPSMGNDVVNHRSPDILSTGKAPDTQRMRLEVCFAFPLPSAAVPTLASRPCDLRVQGFVFLTVHRAIGNKPSTAGVLARGIRSVRHSQSSQGRPGLPKCP